MSIESKSYTKEGRYYRFSDANQRVGIMRALAPATLSARSITSIVHWSGKPLDYNLLSPRVSVFVQTAGVMAHFCAEPGPAFGLLCW